MAIPGIVYLLLFSYLPMFGLIIAFKKFNYLDGIFGSPWVGLDNLRFLFKSPDIWIITRNTLCYNVVFLVIGIGLAVVLAILLDTIGRSKLGKFNQTLAIMPHFMSWVVVAYFVFAVLSESKGIANNLLIKMGKEPISWYTEPKYWPLILPVVYLFKHVGYNSIVYYSTIRGFDQEIYEAAIVDGANWWKQTWYITLPQLRQIIVLFFIIQMGSILNSDFGLFFNVPRNSGLLYSTTSTIDSYVFNGITSLGNISLTSAVTFYQSIIGFVLVIVTNMITKKMDQESALF